MPLACYTKLTQVYRRLLDQVRCFFPCREKALHPATDQRSDYLAVVAQLKRENQQLKEIIDAKNNLTINLKEKLQKRNDELEKALNKQQEVDVMKSYFLSITSHELRTPLTIIKGALNLLQTEKDKLGPDRFNKYFLMAQKNTERLIWLLDDLLDLSRLEFGQLKLELDQVDMVRLVRESIEEFREEATNRLLTFKDELESNTPWVKGDQLRIKQIINNLISNALKFTPAQGRISVYLNHNQQHVILKVRDTGIGIDQAEQEKIFAKFHQGNYTLTRETEGIGLGLAIVKDLVKLHDGKIMVESKKNEGTTFIVQLLIDGPAHPDKVAVKKLKEKWQAPLVLKKKMK